MPWSPLTMTEPWDFQAKVALHGQVSQAEKQNRLEIPATTRGRKKNREPKKAMRNAQSE